MSDKAFEVSLTALTALVLVWIIAGTVLGTLGFPWMPSDLPTLIVITILIGLIILIVGFGILLHYWGKNYMSRG